MFSVENQPSNRRIRAACISERIVSSIAIAGEHPVIILRQMFAPKCCTQEKFDLWRDAMENLERMINLEVEQKSRQEAMEIFCDDCSVRFKANAMARGVCEKRTLERAAADAMVQRCLAGANT